MKNSKKDPDCFIYLCTEKEKIEIDENIEMTHLPRKGEQMMYNGRQYEIVNIMHHYNINFRPYVELFVKELEKEVEVEGDICEYESHIPAASWSGKYKIETSCGYTFYDIPHAVPFKFCPYCKRTIKEVGDSNV